MKRKKLYLIPVLIMLVCTAGWGQDTIKITLKDNSSSYLIKAQEAYNNRDAQQTKQLCFSAIEEDSNNDAAYFLLARVALVEQDPVSAEKFLRQAIRIDSANYYYSSTLGNILMQQNKIYEATALYEKLTNLFPAKSESYVNLFNIYVGSRKTDKIIALADKLEKAMGPNEFSSMAKYEAYISERRADKALEVLLEAEERSPDPTYEVKLGDTYMDLRKDTTALLYYSKALSTTPDYSPAVYGIMEIYRMRGDYPNFLNYMKRFMGFQEVDSALKLEYVKNVLTNPVYFNTYPAQMSECLRIFADANPADTSANLLCAVFMSSVGYADMADTILRRTVNLYPSDKAPSFEYVSFLYSNKRWQQLRDFAVEIKDKFPEYETDIAQFKGIAEYSLNDYDAAIQTFLALEKKAKSKKDTVNLLNIYSSVGDFYHMKGDLKNCYKYYKKALKLNPRYAPVLNNYAWFMATEEHKEYDKALQMSKISIEEEPNNSTFLDTYAWILYLKGDYAESRKYFQQAIGYGGNESIATLSHYGDVLFALKEYSLAFTYYEKAVNEARKQQDMEEEAKIREKIEARRAEVENLKNK